MTSTIMAQRYDLHGDMIIVLEKLSRQLEANNPDAAKILIEYCLERLKKGENICQKK